MKNSIKKLEIKKLFKEFSFLKIDEEYKVEIQNSYGVEFEIAVRQILEENKELDFLFNDKKTTLNSNSTDIQKGNLIFDKNTVYNSNPETSNDLSIVDMNLELSKYCANNNSNKESAQEPNKNQIQNKKEASSTDENIKKIYRTIATKTHPDKVSSIFLNNLYLKAQKAYENNDIFSLYLICNDLDIEYEFPIEKTIDFKSTIKSLREKNSFVESTYLWAWANEEDETKKRNILLHFIVQTYKKI